MCIRDSYYVPSNAVQDEKTNPGSQYRFASEEISNGGSFLWGQAMLIISDLLACHLLSVHELGTWPMSSLHNVNKQLSFMKNVNNQLSRFKNVNKQLSNLGWTWAMN